MFNHLIFAALFCCGLLLVYRGSLNEDDLRILHGKVIDKKIEAIGTYKSGGEKFALIFMLEGSHEKLGIFMGSNNQIGENNLINKIELQQYYKFYIDPSVISTKGVTFGISKITKGGSTLYAENRNKQLYIGIIVSVLILIAWNFYARKK